MILELKDKCHLEDVFGGVEESFATENVSAGADAKTTLSYVDFMRNLPSSRELQTVGSYNDYLEKQVNKNKKKQSSKKSKKKK